MPSRPLTLNRVLREGDMDNEVKVTNAYIAEMDQTLGFSALFKKPVKDVHLRYWMGRFKEKLSQRGRDYGRTRTETMMEFAQKDDSGVVYELDESGKKSNNPVIGNPLGFRIEMNKLMDIGFGLEIPKFKIKMTDIPDDWTAEDLYILSPLLDVEGVE